MCQPNFSMMAILLVALQGGYCCIFNDTFPPSLVDFVTETKSNFCGISTPLLTFPNDSPVYYNLQRILERKWDVSQIVADDIIMISNQFHGIDCALVFGAVYRTVPDIYYIGMRVIYVIKSEEFTNFSSFSSFGDDEKTELDVVFVVYNRTDYSLQHFGFPNHTTQISEFVPNDGSSLRNLHLLNLQFKFFPYETPSSAPQILWLTISKRHNMSYTCPSPYPQLEMSGRQYFEITSLHRMAYSVCFIVPVPRRRPIQYILIYPFDFPTWMSIIVMISIVLLIVRLVNQGSSFSQLLIELFRTIINSPHWKPRSPFGRQIFTMFVVGSFILNTTYQSLITAVIFKPSFYPPLNTLDQINRTCRPMVRLHYDEMSYDFQDTRHGENAWSEAFDWQCFYGACLLMEHFQQICSSFEPITRNLNCSMYDKASFQDRAHPVFGILQIQRQSLIKLVQFYAGAFSQGALFHFVDTVDKDTAKRMKYGGERGRKNLKVLTLEDHRVVWMILLQGFFVSGVALVAEILHYHLKRRLRAE